jgi:ribonuclease/clavin/mitogillin
MLIRITPQIILVRPEGKTLYPYSNSLYINDNIKTIIDAGAGGNAYQEIAPDHIELLLLSHYHFDHINGWPFFPRASVYTGKEEALVYSSPEEYFTHTGRFRWRELMGQDKTEKLRSPQDFPDDVPVRPGFQNIKLEGCFSDKQQFNLGQNSIQALRLPGHTKGHYGFYIEEEGLLFSGDLDLAPQGPWYGGESSDVGDLLESIARIIAINPRILVTSHRRVFKKPEDNIIKAVLEYRDIVLEREDRILKVLKHPATLDGIVSAIGDFPGLGRSQYATFYAKMMTHKHLEHMIKTGQVKKLGNSSNQHFTHSFSPPM